MNQSHGFNSVHGRMPAVATGAAAANGELIYIGISGDGDSLSIGLGQLCHAIRRNVDMLYVIENNGVYGLTKGQFSASADVGSKAKKGEENRQKPIDPALLALSLGCSFVARAFSGDKTQLVPILKAGLAHKGFAMVDVISPCVTFNDHEGSTKSYLYTRTHQEDLTAVDFVPLRRETTAHLEPGVTAVTMPDGSVVRFLKVGEDYDPTDRVGVMSRIRSMQDSGVVPTGLLFIEETSSDMHAHNRTVARPLIDVPYEELCPGSASMEALMEEFR
jgi:2-oxoglutarate ferredoxin oxidoreductase subunit beta